MKLIASLKISSFVIALVCALTILGISPSFAQGGPTLNVSYDILPNQDFKDPIISENGSEVNDPQVKLSKLRAELTYPIVFSKGRTVLINDFVYQLIEFEFKYMEYPLERLHSGSYTLMLQHRLSRGWSIWALGTPSIASDLGAEVSRDDFNMQAAAIIIHHFSERFAVGFGAAYSTQFGSAIPMPVLAFDWNNGRNMMVHGIIPASFEFWYRPNPRFDLGLVVSGDGNNFHGDPAVYQVTNPELRYTMLTVGPAVKVNLSKFMRLRAEAGLIGLHRFEFYDGNDESGSYDLNPSQYLRIGLEIGGQ
jgi:hypothetical protein